MLKRIFYYVFIFFNIYLLAACDRIDQNVMHGYIEGDFTYITAQTTGILNDLHVMRGDVVDKDQMLFIIDAEPQASEFNEAKAKLRQAQANLADLEKGKRPSEIAALEATRRQILSKLDYSRKTVARYQQLVKKNALDQSKLDEAISDYNHLRAQLEEIAANLKTAKSEARVDEILAAKANLEAARAVLKKANWHLAQKKVYSPMIGRVIDVYYREGELISGNDPVLSLLAPENVYVIFFVPETQRAALHLKQKVRVLCDRCKSPIEAEIRFISPKAEFTPPVIYSEKTRVSLVYKVEASLSEEDAKVLHPGQPISVRLETRN